MADAYVRIGAKIRELSELHKEKKLKGIIVITDQSGDFDNFTLYNGRIEGALHLIGQLEWVKQNLLDEIKFTSQAGEDSVAEINTTPQ